MRLYVGGNQWSIQGERDDWGGYRCFSAVNNMRCIADPSEISCLLDSGAFSDSPQQRLTPEKALERQIKWEARASQRLNCTDWHVEAIVSYDLLIDEVWTGAERSKRRWGLKDAEWAVAETVAAARYLAGRRDTLAPRQIVLSAQGVDAIQYSECVDELLKIAGIGDWIGLGGWCVLGRMRSLLPEFWKACHIILPKIAASGVNHIHIFGVTFLPALGGLQWLADQHGLTVSTDSTAPVMACTRADKRRSGARRDYWRDNVAWWQRQLACIRETHYYQEPPRLKATRQLSLLDF